MLLDYQALLLANCQAQLFTNSIIYGGGGGQMAEIEVFKNGLCHRLKNHKHQLKRFSFIPLWFFSEFYKSKYYYGLYST
jgi:hypothetical protein